MLFVWLLSGAFPTRIRSARSAAQQALHAAEKSYRDGHVAQTLLQLDAARMADPTWAEPHFIHAKLLERSGHIAEARDEALVAHRLAPTDTAITLKALRLDMMLPRPRETERLAQEAVALLPRSAEAHLILGQALAASGDAQHYPKALHSLQAAVDLDCAAPQPYIEIGKLTHRMGEEAQAITALEAAARALDAQANGTPVAVTELNLINDWILGRRETAFLLAQILMRQSRTVESRQQADLASRASACADRLKTLVALATTQPPNRSARDEIVAICHHGRGLFLQPH